MLMAEFVPSYLHSYIFSLLLLDTLLYFYPSGYTVLHGFAVWAYSDVFEASAFKSSETQQFST